MKSYMFPIFANGEWVVDNGDGSFTTWSQKDYEAKLKEDPDFFYNLGAKAMGVTGPPVHFKTRYDLNKD